MSDYRTVAALKIAQTVAEAARYGRATCKCNPNLVLQAQEVSMHSDMMHDNHEMARARHAYEHDARSRQLKKNWFVALVALWIVIWGFVGTSGILPRPLWVVILGLLLLTEFGIALFGPRIGQSKTH